MTEYEVTNYTVQPLDGDDQIEVVIHSSDGNKWEYGIPFSRSTGRYMFEEIDVLAMDFGDDFGAELTEKLDRLVESLVRGSLEGARRTIVPFRCSFLWRQPERTCPGGGIRTGVLRAPRARAGDRGRPDPARSADGPARPRRTLTVTRPARRPARRASR
jgi:hypothetical protein